MITVHIIVSDADAASAWYQDVFGAVERSRIVLPDGKLIHVAKGALGRPNSAHSSPPRSAPWSFSSRETERLDSLTRADSLG
jgi:uncharacterized glyoxalase superfamily protein PhnB